MSKTVKKVIVNFLSCSRIVAALFLPFIFRNASVVGLVLLLSVLFLSDFLDGRLARKWNVQTVGGMLLDPLGDKVLAIACIFALLGSHSYLAFLLLFELAICIINTWRILAGEVVTANFIGKFKTWVLSITLSIGVIHQFNPCLLGDIFRFFKFPTSALCITDEVVFATSMLTLGCELVTIACYLKEAFDERKKTKKLAKFKKLEEILERLFDEEKFGEDRYKPLKDIIREK